jgi:hypothetical protein
MVKYGVLFEVRTEFLNTIYRGIGFQLRLAVGPWNYLIFQIILTLSN